MATIQWRPEVNPLTVPPSYKLRYIPRGVVGIDDLAAEIAKENPIYNQEMAKGVILALLRRIQQNLINGKQVTLDKAMSLSLSLPGNFLSLDNHFPPLNEILRLRIRGSIAYLREIRRQAKFTRLPAKEKLPVITTVKDSHLKLQDVLFMQGVLRIVGQNLSFDPDAGTGQCVLEGSRSGRAVQTQFGPITDKSIIFVPNIPAQAAAHNNEYLLSVAVRYSSSSGLKKSTYQRRLRSVLPWDGSIHANSPGLLTGKAEAPYVVISSVSELSTGMLRVQVLFDQRQRRLYLSLIDIKDGGVAGPAVTVTGNGEYLLQAFPSAPVGSLGLRVDNYSDLLTLVWQQYDGQLLDVLDIRVA